VEELRRLGEGFSALVARPHSSFSCRPSGVNTLQLYQKTPILPGFRESR
jgi:hypothetical protein